MKIQLRVDIRGPVLYPRTCERGWRAGTCSACGGKTGSQSSVPPQFCYHCLFDQLNIPQCCNTGYGTSWLYFTAWFHPCDQLCSAQTGETMIHVLFNGQSPFLACVLMSTKILPKSCLCSANVPPITGQHQTLCKQNLHLRFVSL